MSEITCGGCGNADPQKRCIGCLHPFSALSPVVVAPVEADDLMVRLQEDADGLEADDYGHEASSIRQAADRIDTLTAERDGLEEIRKANWHALQTMGAKIENGEGSEALKARIVELEAALKPLADVPLNDVDADEWLLSDLNLDAPHLIVADVRAAARALSKSEPVKG